MDVVLVLLPQESTGQRLFTMKEIGYLRAMLEQDGFCVGVIDCDRYGPTGAASYIADAQPAVVGLPIQWRDTIVRLGEQPIVQELRGSGVQSHYSATGILATIFYRSLLENLPQLDSVVLGESELIFRNLVQRVRRKEKWQQAPGIAYRKEGGTVAKNLPSPRVEDLDDLPFPTREYLADRARFPVAPIESSRGCASQCIFCRLGIYAAIHEGALWRRRSAERVVDEMQEIVETYGTRSFYFVDDNFLDEEAHGRAIAEELLRRDLRVRFSIECNVDSVEEDLFLLLRRAGLRMAGLGLESGAQSVLDRYEKGTSLAANRQAVATLQRLGINCEPSMILFDPVTRLEEVQETVAFLAETGLHRTARPLLPLFHRMMIYPGTAARERFASVLQPMEERPETARPKPWLAANANQLVDWATHRYQLADPRVQALWEATEYYGHLIQFHGRVFYHLRAHRDEIPPEEQKAWQLLVHQIGQWEAHIGEQRFVLLREAERLLRPVLTPQKEHRHQLEMLVQNVIEEFDRRFFGKPLIQRVQELGLQIDPPQTDA